ncbi:MAG: MbnP family protein [Flavobacteriales bacterium]|nr:MbnP family protein [Flavobacteriales bacterium]
MNRKISFILILASVFSLLILSSCEHRKEGNGTLQVAFSEQFKGEPFVLGSVYHDDMGNRLRVDNFMSYFSLLNVISPDGTETLVNDFSLVNFANGDVHTIELESGDYKGLEFNLGIPKEYNKDVDPTTYPNDHPLSVQGSQGMFWHWNTGYIFTKLEGKADTTGVEGAELLHPFAFHVGDDPMFRQHDASNFNFTIEPGSTQIIHVIIDIEKIMKGEDDEIDLATDFITHTSGNTVLASRFMNNFNKAIRVE